VAQPKQRKFLTVPNKRKIWGRMQDCEIDGGPVVGCGSKEQHTAADILYGYNSISYYLPL
jgi:hypothetical protein